MKLYIKENFRKYQKDAKNKNREFDVYVDGDRALYTVEERAARNWDTDKRPEYNVYRWSCPIFKEGYRSHTDSDNIASRRSAFEAFQVIRSDMEQHKPKAEGTRNRTVEAAQLPGSVNKTFYPTPRYLAGKMLSMVDWKMVSTVLEPSAGKGDLIDALQRMREDDGYRERSFHVLSRNTEIQEVVDCVELDADLRDLLRGKGYRVVGDDFLGGFHPQKRYDVIMMNPPFDNGAAHLLHALALVKSGGQVVCLLNAETVRNPYTKERQLLRSKLEELGAKVVYVRDAFKHAERRANVDVAIIYVNIPQRRMTDSSIFSRLKAAEEKNYEKEQNEPNALLLSDDLLGLIQSFDFEAKMGVALMEEYDAVTPYFMEGIDAKEPLIQLSVSGRTYNGMSNGLVNEYLRGLRSKYWAILLDRPSLREKMTSAMQSEYSQKLHELREYDFNRHNVTQVFYDIMSQLNQGVADSIYELFDTLSGKYSWHRDIDLGNVHYYNGWCTNKSYKVGMKVVLPINGYSSYSWQKDKLDEYDVAGKIADLERCLTYLDKGEIGWRRDPYNVIRAANSWGTQNKALEFTYFDAKFYKKGTCHIKFKPEAEPVIERLNIFAARGRGWLPPRYGKVKYQDMTPEEQRVVDEFQGREAYEKIMLDPSNMIVESATLTPLLSA